jgi:hypothetical protein
VWLLKEAWLPALALTAVSHVGNIDVNIMAGLIMCLWFQSTISEHYLLIIGSMRDVEGGG